MFIYDQILEWLISYNIDLPEQFGVNDNLYLVHFQNSSHILGNAKKSITDIGLRIILPKASENSRSHVSIPMTPLFYIV